MPPYPYRLEHDFDLQSDFREAWHVRLQLLFQVTVCPTGDKKKTTGANDGKKGGPNAKNLHLAFFSTFEPLPNAPKGVTQEHGCEILYEPKGKPILYVGFAADILARTCLSACFLDGNSRNTIPFSRRRHNNAAAGIKADTAPDSGDGSSLFETNVVEVR